MWKKRKSSTTFTFNGEKVFLAASQTLGTVFSYFQTSRIGLTQEEVEARQSLYGKNEVEHEQKKNPISTFIKAFINPFIGVLTALAIISFVLDVLPGEQDWTAIIIILTMVIASSILRFWQEWKANASSEALLKMVTNTCYVRRAGNQDEEIKILSGDNDAVVRTIARQVGIRTDNALTGPIFETMSEEEKMKAVNQTTVFSKLTPIQKTEIITLLQAQQHTVGFLGDGINDAAALRQSDIGISVDSAVDIAKESADIILLEKSLMVLEDGVLEGRKTFGNITKYIKMTASSNFGNMFSVMAASAFLPFLPMLPIHLLIQNLLYDISQTLIVHMIRTRKVPFIQSCASWQVTGLTLLIMAIVSPRLEALSGWKHCH